MQTPPIFTIPTEQIPNQIKKKIKSQNLNWDGILTPHAWQPTKTPKSFPSSKKLRFRVLKATPNAGVKQRLPLPQAPTPPQENKNTETNNANATTTEARGGGWVAGGVGGVGGDGGRWWGRMVATAPFNMTAEPPPLWGWWVGLFVCVRMVRTLSTWNVGPRTWIEVFDFFCSCGRSTWPGLLCSRFVMFD